MTASIPDMPLCRIISYTQPVPYKDALARQYALADQRQREEVPDTLLLLEHPAVITLGRGANAVDLLTPEDDLRARGITVERVDRGGEITYHGPGQLVGYPILDLRHQGQDLHRYLRDLEEIIIRTLAVYDLRGERVPGRTGVWVQNRKIAAIGIKVSRWISLHGWALNITTDLTPFRQDIVPCGIYDRDVTSLAELMRENCPARQDVQRHLSEFFVTQFGAQPAFETFETERGILSL